MRNTIFDLRLQNYYKFFIYAREMCDFMQFVAFFYRWSPTRRRMIQVRRGETKKESNAQPRGSRCLFTAMRYAI